MISGDFEGKHIYPLQNLPTALPNKTTTNSQKNLPDNKFCATRTVMAV